MKPTVLVIDDEASYRQLYADTLKRAGFGVRTAESAAEAWVAMRTCSPAMIVSDVRMPGVDGIRFLHEIMARKPHMPCLLITAYADVRDAVKALKLGAVDYLEKPVDLDELVAAVSDALHLDADHTASDVPASFRRGMIAESPAMRVLLRDAYQVARSEATVLLTGESGVGKEVLAAFIHRCSSRAERRFVALNCAAIPANTLASELFGHEKGAYTGAIAARKGIFREADRGTLFLDEIGDMPLELQPSLLRAIESGRLSPLGSDRELTVDVRLIAATNRNLEAKVRKGAFREDLYYRLNVIAFEIPPLRERPEDILPLARHFLSLRKEQKRLSPATANLLARHAWPGNVRELANAMARAAILANTEVILPEHLPPAVTTATDRVQVPAPESVPEDASVKTMEEVENDAIRRTLEKTGGNRTRAAELLGISRRALIYKLKRMDPQ